MKKMEKVYYLYIKRQLGFSSPLLDRIETINAKSANEAIVIGEEKCRHYTNQSKGRYIYKCEVSEGREL